jgi:hypothetical protein
MIIWAFLSFEAAVTEVLPVARLSAASGIAFGELEEG